MQKIRTLSILSIMLLITLFLEINSIIAIGPIINRYHPCLQNPANSFPCYGIYDIYAIILGLIVVSVLLCIIWIQIFSIKKRKEQGM